MHRCLVVTGWLPAEQYGRPRDTCPGAVAALGDADDIPITVILSSPDADTASFMS